ncbi:conjugal transfer protein TrbI [Leptotrichia sp. OH3620_COT-345]|uniref:TrbI/VirB10 family protein n=1 Tax=Leptotrichia sp. OH3620_COT-345 TaxID=2491048 RepID=UPI000F653F10|nr:TrbI/VirB10 family protein [Leptotrichia sp. OH3620_COT-345]RRD40371.1 conjugal transfer protein TrbI [Leptotrichia sp. OH3620_COT-345]
MTEREIAELTLNELKNDIEELKNTDDYVDEELRNSISQKQRKILGMADELEDRFSQISEKRSLRQKNIIEKNDINNIDENRDYSSENFKKNKNSTNNLNNDEVVYSEKKRKNNRFLLFILGIFALSLFGIVLYVSSPKNTKKEKINLADPNSFKLTDVDKSKEDEDKALVQENDNTNVETATGTTIPSIDDTDISKIPPGNDIDEQENNRNRDIEDINNAIAETENAQFETPQKSGSGNNGLSFINRSKEKDEEKNNEKQNSGSEEKNNILKRNVLNKVKSPYEVKQGSVIPATLDTEINTDLPGTILAHVREDVYDSITGNYLLIPKGSKLYGRYESSITAGQNRVLIVFDKLILTNGNHMDLLAMQGADRLGNSGLKDKRSNHILSLIGNAVFSSILNITNKLAGNTHFKIGKNVTVGLNGNVSSGGEEGNSSPYEAATAKILERAVDRQPTITIRKGYRFNIIVNEDLELEPLKKQKK